MRFIAHYKVKNSLQDLCQKLFGRTYQSNSPVFGDVVVREIKHHGIWISRADLLSQNTILSENKGLVGKFRDTGDNILTVNSGLRVVPWPSTKKKHLDKKKK